MENENLVQSSEAESVTETKNTDTNTRLVTVEIRNSVNIVGYIDTPIELSHTIRDEGIYTFILRVPRVNSNIDDELIVELPERGNNLSDFSKGDRVRIEGQFRSSNRVNDSDGKTHLFLAIFVDSIKHESSTYKVNEIRLRGNMCRKPNLRITSKGREVCDTILAVNRTYNRSDYIPCITWGRDAKFVSGLPVGTGFFISGRVQSRKYTKKLESGETEDRVTYEVSVSEIKEVQQDEQITETRAVSVDI